jgi:hypothetical protein
MTKTPEVISQPQAMESPRESNQTGWKSEVAGLLKSGLRSVENGGGILKGRASGGVVVFGALSFVMEGMQLGLPTRLMRLQSQLTEFLREECKLLHFTFRTNGRTITTGARSCSNIHLFSTAGTGKTLTQ